MSGVEHAQSDGDELAAVVGQVKLADVTGARQTVVVAERVVVVRDGHDPDARVAYWRLYEAPETPVDNQRTVGRPPDEQTCAR